VRHLLAILLLIVAAVHPLAHIGSDDLVACPCAHGAVDGVLPPSVADEPPKPHRYAAHLPSFLPVAAATELPARAPPIA
jgi:hypothetical protein